MGIHTTYKFRHFKGDNLVWASGLGELDGSIRRGNRALAEVIAAQPWQDNELVNEGEQAMLDVFFRGATAPSGFFFRLFDDVPTETDGIGDLTGEVSGTGYAAVAVSRDGTDWPSLALDSGDFQASSATKTFEATGTWTDATHLILATSSDGSGKLIAWAPLSTTRTLVSGDSLDVSMAIKLT